MPATSKSLLIIASLFLLFTLINGFSVEVITPYFLRAEILAALSSVLLLLVAIIWTDVVSINSKRENLIGKQVIGVCNFPEKNIAGVVSQVLILGSIDNEGKVTLLHPSQKAENGLPIA